MRNADQNIRYPKFGGGGGKKKREEKKIELFQLELLEHIPIHAYQVSKYAQVRLVKELYGNQIEELYHSLPYHMIEFVLDEFEWLVLFFSPSRSTAHNFFKSSVSQIIISIYFLFLNFGCSKVTVTLRYADLLTVLPSRIRVVAWPVHPSKKNSSNSSATSRKENGSIGIAGETSPIRLTYAEDALRTMSLPEGAFFLSYLLVFEGFSRDD